MRRRRVPDLEPLPAEQQRRLDAWVAHLDVNLEEAQRVLRLPPAELPPPPGETPAPPAPKRLGAYARRASR